ncbi:MAG: HAMP domain-containing protein [Bacteroidota bacterium]
MISIKKSLISRLVLMFLLVGLSIVSLLGIYFYYYSKEAIISRTFDQLTAVREIKKRQVEFLFAERINNVGYLSKSIEVQKEMARLIDNKLSNSQSFSKVDFRESGFSNLYFVWKDVENGKLISSSVDLVEENKYLNSDAKHKQLQMAWEEIEGGASSIVCDFSKRFPNDTNPILMIAAPVKDFFGKTLGIIALELPSESITNILIQYTPETGFGKSGEAYIIGDDFLMRSNSRFIKNSILTTKLTSEAARNAINGKSGKIKTQDYRNIQVYSSYSPLHIPGLKWAILSEIDYKEAMIPIISMRNDFLFLSLIFALFIFSISYILALTITNPIRKLEKAAQKIGAGEFDAIVTNNSKDEIGSLTNSFNQMATKLNTMTSALIEREERLNHFYKATLEGIIIHQAGIPVLTNQAISRLSGFSDTILMSMNLQNWIVDYNEELISFETEMRTSNGNKVDIEVQNNRLQFKGEDAVATIIRDISERKKAEQELLLERSKRMSALLDGQEMERHRISRELHDGLGQNLVGIKLRLENTINQNLEKTQETIGEIKTYFSASIDELRRISNNLRPSILSELGLITSLETLCRDFTINTNIPCEFSSFGEFQNIPQKTTTYLYRIAQEGLNNAAKHATASLINLQMIENSSNYILIIEDNGKGFVFENKPVSRGNGIYNMRERATLLDGTLTIESKEGHGTTLRIKIPKL